MGPEALGLCSIMRGCLGVRMSKHWGSELSWTQTEHELKALFGALSSLAEVARGVHDGQAWKRAKKGCLIDRAGVRASYA